jgi:DNA-binding MarR family transcriptional regulator
MPKLSDAQLVVLSTASQRSNRHVYPVTLKAKGQAVGNVLKSLLAKGLLEEVPGRADDTVWRHDDDGSPLTLAVTDAGLAALNIETDDAKPSDAEPARAKAPAKTKHARREPSKRTAKPRSRKPAKQQREPRTDTKQAQLIAMLKRARGVTVEEIAEELDWQHHTVRGAMAGALKKKLGLKIVSEKHDKRGRVYRIEE